MTSDLRFRRGDLVIAVFSRDYGKPRPAVVVQSDLFNDSHPSIVLCPLTSHLEAAPLFRIRLEASETHGLQHDSEVMLDKVAALDRSRIRQRVGKLSPAQMGRIDRALRIWLDLPLSGSPL